MSLLARLFSEALLSFVRSHHIIQPNIFSQEDYLLDTNHPDSDDGDFQASLNRILKRSEGHDDDSDW